MRYLITPSLMKVSGDALKELGWREMEKVPAFPGLTDAGAAPRLCIPGGGITKGLYADRWGQGRRRVWALRFLVFFFFYICVPVASSSCAEDLPLAVLLLFCSEGDNIPDALKLASQLDDWLHLLHHPVSGRLRSVMTSSPDCTIPDSQFSQKPRWSFPWGCFALDFLLVPFQNDMFQERAPFTVDTRLL